MALLAMLAGNRPTEVGLSEALAPRHSLVRSHSWERLIRVIRERPVTGAVVSLGAMPVYPSPEGVLAGLRKEFPNLPLVVLVMADREPSTLFRLGKAGIENLVLFPVQNLRSELDRTLARARHGGPTSLVTRALSGHLAPRELDAARLALESVHRRWTAEDLAEEVGFARPYLSECFKASGLPSIGHFLLWTRLFHAGHWLEEPGRTGESVGRQLDYSSGAAFRRALKHYTGATPTQVREQGGLRFVLRQFLLRTGLLFPRPLPA